MFRSKYPLVKLRRDYCHRGFIDRVRNAACDRALEWGADYILWWDDDIVAQDDALIRLFEADKDVISGIAFGRTEPYAMCSYRHKTGDYQDLSGFDPIVANEAHTGIKKCDATGTGLMLMKVDVLSDLHKPYFRWPEEAAEDIEFCSRLRQLGYEIHIDTDIELGHLKFQPEIIMKDKHVHFCDSMRQLIKRNPDLRKDVSDLERIERLISGSK